MKIIFEDFTYKGKHFDKFVCELNNIQEVEGDFEDRFIEYIKESLNVHLGIEA